MEKKAATAFDIQTYDEQMSNNRQRASSGRSRTPGAQMSEEMEYNKKMPNVVARLMGLETFPNQPPVITADTNLDGYLFNKSAKTLQEYQQQEDGCLHNLVAHEIHSCIREEYRDAYDVSQQSTRKERMNYTLGHDSCNMSYEKQMAFIRQKFAEAKCLASNENIFKSKEFDDAVDVLSLNSDMFLKVLEEPNSVLSEHVHNIYTPPPPSQKQRIIVLKPSKKTEWKNTKGVNDREFSAGPEIGQGTKISRWNSCFIQPKEERSPHPIKIVVLKPSPGKQQYLKTLASSPDFPLKLAEDENCSGGSETNKSIESREVGSEVRWHEEESVGSQRSSDAQVSIPPNEYVANRSSICKAEHSFSEEEGDITPTSEHSCSDLNIFGSNSSVSSSNKASYSHEPSAMKEAKRRLSERWAVVSTNGVNQVPDIQDWRSSSTLAQILAITKMRGEERSIEAPNSWITTSKNMPFSTSISKNMKFGVKASDLLISKSVALEDITKRLKSTVKGKLSSLFSSKNRTAREKSFPSSSMCSILKEEASLCSLKMNFGKNTSGSLYLDNGSKEQTSTEPTNLPERSKTSDSFSGNQDQPSPNSILATPFNDNAVSCYSNNAAFSQSLSRSPPIESIVRSLSWNDAQSESFPNNFEKFWNRADEEQEGLNLVQKLLSFAGIDNEVCSSIFIRWHSLETPLNPVLATRFLNGENDISRRRESDKRLIFDSVNEALVQIGNHTLLDLHPWLGSPWNRAKSKRSTALVKEDVFAILRDWNYEKEKWASCDIKNTSQIVDSFAKTELFGKKWVEINRLHMDGFSTEISESVLDELVLDSVSDIIAA